jgi:hypothetical protein
MTDSIKKKRGRKPKIYINMNNKINDNNIIISEDENIIYHIPLKLQDIHNEDTNMNLFLSCNNNTTNSNHINEDNYTSEHNLSNSTINKTSILNNINKIITHTLNFTKNTKCWWCKYAFDTVAVQLPENYYNDTFFCIGNFCSFNCCKSYNLDLNDNLIYKRESLLNLLYHLTYSIYISIKAAPHWITLEDFGGNLTIKQFRENFITNTQDFLILHPPLITRQMQIEESYIMSKFKEVPISKVNKLYSEVDSEYVIKRNKPIQSNQFNLESTMGLLKKKR